MMRRSTSRPAYWSKAWRVLAWQCKDRDAWRCRDCGGAGKLEAHHIIPVERGGAMWDLSNLITLCRTCHRQRHGSNTPRPDWKALVEDAARD